MMGGSGVLHSTVYIFFLLVLLFLQDMDAPVASYKTNIHRSISTDLHYIYLGHPAGVAFYLSVSCRSQSMAL